MTAKQNKKIHQTKGLTLSQELEEVVTPKQTVFRSGFVVILGRPNAGKSTLVNLLTGSKVSIVTPRPQTTRHRILAMVNLPNVQVVLIDTPGLASRKYKLDECLSMITDVAGADADAAIVIVDAKSLNADLIWAKQTLAQIAPRPALLLINKLDLMPPGWHLTALESIGELPRNISLQFFSAKIGKFTSDIINWCIEHLPPGPQYFPPELSTDRTEDWQAAELVREQVILALHMELPYAAAVAIDEYKKTTAGRINIHATIFVERESQKPIVIGNGGEKIKRIGIDARKEISQVLGSPVDLFLKVAVLPNWRDDERALQRLGFYER